MADQLPVPNNNTSERARAKPGPRVLARRATGPRTLPGKQRSSKNALKHGVFSKEILLKGEVRAEFQALHHELREDLHAEGFLEELLVENLAILIWRRKRFFNAETAEIAKASELIAWDTSQEQFIEAEKCERLSSGRGMLSECTNPFVLERIIELLSELRDNFETRGFDEEEDEGILDRIYESSSTAMLRGHFVWTYLGLGRAANDPDRCKALSLGPEDLRKLTTDLIDDEIKRLKNRKNDIEQAEEIRLTYAKRASVVPSQEVSERLLRYETHLSREFDRTLSQLERRQRMRLGQPVPPTLKVELSR